MKCPRSVRLKSRRRCTLEKNGIEKLKLKLQYNYLAALSTSLSVTSHAQCNNV